ncbi:hypothetical protein TSAR_010855, partial [Trichomalopsis sarcophagae]
TRVFICRSIRATWCDATRAVSPHELSLVGSSVDRRGSRPFRLLYRWRIGLAGTERARSGQRVGGDPSGRQTRLSGIILTLLL